MGRPHRRHSPEFRCRDHRNGTTGALSWQSLTGVQNRGTYHLTPAQNGTTIHLRLEYELDNPLLEETVRQAAKPLIQTLSREIIDNVEAELQKSPGKGIDQEGPRPDR